MDKSRKKTPGSPGEEFYSRVKKYILDNKMTGPGQSVAAGVSGGADSLCLFMILLRLSAELGIYLHAVHVHHGLRESAEGDLRFVEDLCRRYGVPCTCVRADAAARAKTWKTGIEEAGRRIRYEAFDQVRLSLEKERGTTCRIAVAHHMEDQAETVLFHLCRGTDLRGAGGMLPVNGNLIRPLLMESRASIEEYLTAQGISWRVDETNEDTSYTRNFLRREIMPRLSAGVNTAAAGHLARFADQCADAERYLEKAAEEALRRCLAPGRIPGLPDSQGSAAAVPGAAAIPGAATGQDTTAIPDATAIPDKATGPDEATGLGAAAGPDTSAGPGTAPQVLALKISTLAAEDPYIQKRILYRALRACADPGLDSARSLGAVHVEAAAQLLKGRESARLSMPGGVTVLREAGRLLFCPEKFLRAKGRSPEQGEAGGLYPVSPDAYSWRLLDFDGDLSSIPRNKYTKWFDYDKMAVFPDFRTRQAGDFMKISAGAGKTELMTRKVARVMLDAGIPSRFRDLILFPCRGKEALWIPGLRMGDSCRITSATKRILEITCACAGPETARQE